MWHPLHGPRVGARPPQRIALRSMVRMRATKLQLCRSCSSDWWSKSFTKTRLRVGVCSVATDADSRCIERMAQSRCFMTSRPPSPFATLQQVKLLGNGRYAVMVNAAGAGYSQWCGLAVTRWHEDPVGASYLLLRDEDSGEVWPAGLQPCAGADNRCGGI